MSPLTEAQWHTRQIKAFINAEPIDVELHRVRTDQTAAGGVTRRPEHVLAPQRFRLTPFKRRLVNDWGLSLQGQEVKTADWVMHGAPDADVKVDDYFQYRNHEYVVIWVNDHNMYRTAAGLRVRGRLGGE
jgi:hypothetical protein